MPICVLQWVSTVVTLAQMFRVLLDELMRRCELYTVSQSEIVTVPGYSYLHSNRQLLISYMLDVGAASMASSCTVHEMEDLNTSDHLPISVEFSWMLEINTGFSVRHARFEDGQGVLQI